ncbi:hypothetical protein BCR34DRAFT_116429 [Clohesyomyces aquaticus]|uniref:Mid2 domain-containing protein n=1 Tax=Clohesyomyces aquaticus TaxID=1231657 RepID=A0A1Y1YQ71_9PLEO|nr:hypothetical protein BCR34DRAFT_116429 [Clohesyomyces aquaticus]
MRLQPRFLSAIALALISALPLNLTLVLASTSPDQPAITAPALLPREVQQNDRLIGYYLPSETLDCENNFFFTTAVFLISKTSSTIATCLGTQWKTKVKEADWWVDCSHRVGINGTSTFVETSTQSNCATGTLLPSLGAPTANLTYYFIPTSGVPSTLYRTAPFKLTSTSTPSSPNQNPSNSSSGDRAAIIGGSVGGAIVLLIVIVCVAVWVLRRGMHKQDEKRAQIERERELMGMGSGAVAEVPLVPVVHYYK